MDDLFIQPSLTVPNPHRHSLQISINCGTGNLPGTMKLSNVSALSANLSPPRFPVKMTLRWTYLCQNVALSQNVSENKSQTRICLD